MAIPRPSHGSLCALPTRSAWGSGLPVRLGEASERALPAGAVPLAPECALLDAEVPHCPVGTAHQDLRAEEGRRDGGRDGEDREAAGPPAPARPRPLTWVSPPAPQHRALTASSRRGCPAAVKLAACLRRRFTPAGRGRQSHRVAGGRPRPPLPDAGSCHPPFRIPVSVPTHTWFQCAPATAIMEPADSRTSGAALRHQRAPRVGVGGRGSAASGRLKGWQSIRRPPAPSGIAYTKSKGRDL